MFRYRYCWTLRSDADLEIEVRIFSEAAVGARRELTRFLADQPRGDWTVCGLVRRRERIEPGEDGEDAARSSSDARLQGSRFEGDRNDDDRTISVWSTHPRVPRRARL